MYIGNKKYSSVHREPVRMKKNRKNFCPVLFTLDLIGGKWKIPIIAQLQVGTKRFKELEKGIEGITARMLIKELKDLEENNLVLRQVYAQVPPKVEYSLTQSGKNLKPLIGEIKKWGNSHLGKV
jgi:DNA-binding HxlR family transcriptional regulator